MLAEDVPARHTGRVPTSSGVLSVPKWWTQNERPFFGLLFVQLFIFFSRVHPYSRFLLQCTAL